MTEKLSDSDGSFLVKIARKAVTEFISNGNKIKLDADNEKNFRLTLVCLLPSTNIKNYEDVLDFQCQTKNYHMQ